MNEFLSIVYGKTGKNATEDMADCEYGAISVYVRVHQWAMKHKNSLVESTTTLNDNIDSESNQAALIDAANLLLKDNCSIFEAERILFHCFIPQAQKYNKFIKVLLICTNMSTLRVRVFPSPLPSLRLSLSLSLCVIIIDTREKEREKTGGDSYVHVRSHK